MSIHYIIAIVIIRYLQKKLQTRTELPEWDRKLKLGMTASITLLAISLIFPQLKGYLTWIGQAFCFMLVYLILYQPAFKVARQAAISIIPLIVVVFIRDLTKLISRSFYYSWRNYFEAAAFFSFVWLIALLIISNKQAKALEKEKEKAKEKEKEYEITEKLKFQLEIQVAERTASLTLQKEELEKTISELKSTQTQLIHAEKMASLGELTAGIAHEIQNPLNFVNNFSELNTELIDELEQALANGQQTEALSIAKDIRENEQKINHHGKRADGIVKGMLQHSRSSNGQKEPTDINVLADEYLRLAYHGLRAKDKSFNATMKTDFDENMGMLNIITQDIGRVILNLITNAFYTVGEKKKEGLPDYEPTVFVSTKKMNGRVEIKVADNGNGIPSKVLDKIFQPFFTTKPSGQGTGLGLSLSYEIIKSHGGELKVNTKEGEGSEFIITLIG